MTQQAENQRGYQYPRDLGAALTLIRDCDAWWAERYCLIFMAFTATGSRQATQATWGEIDWQNADWQIPAKHNGNGLPDNTPLSTQAIEILDFAKRKSNGKSLIFPHEREASPIDHQELTNLMDKMEIPLFFGEYGLLFDVRDAIASQ